MSLLTTLSVRHKSSITAVSRVHAGVSSSLCPVTLGKYFSCVQIFSRCDVVVLRLGARLSAAHLLTALTGLTRRSADTRAIS